MKRRSGLTSIKLLVVIAMIGTVAATLFALSARAGGSALDRVPLQSAEVSLTRKLLFLDYREVDSLRGFRRELEQPQKHPGNPLFVPDQPWEGNSMRLYGSVVKAPDMPFQMWYTIAPQSGGLLLAYAESDDGVTWHRPLFDIHRFNDQPTNIVLDENVHGAAVIYDADEPREDWRYKMLAGLAPTNLICALHSPDGIRWKLVRRNPVICTPPDCPIGLLRGADGRYIAYHRFLPYTGARTGRCVCRSESWNFVDWTNEPRMVLDQDPGDPPRIEFYGMGAVSYGPYEIGTLWMFHSDEDDYGTIRMNGYQEAELAYARSGYAWHRAAQGVPFIPHGEPDTWEEGNLQCASQPVFLKDEIRYYYAASNGFHGYAKRPPKPPQIGLGMASLKPDRFVALCADDEPAELLTVAFVLPSGNVRVNAKTDRDGWVKVEMLDPGMRAIEGGPVGQSIPITGDSIEHVVSWQEYNQPSAMAGKAVRLRIHARRTRLYSIYSPAPSEEVVYHQFSALRGPQ